MDDNREFLDLVRKFVGPILVGVITNAFLLGIGAQQYYVYFTSDFKDGLLVK